MTFSAWGKVWLLFKGGRSFPPLTDIAPEGLGMEGKRAMCVMEFKIHIKAMFPSEKKKKTGSESLILTLKNNILFFHSLKVFSGPTM